jgi:hypothetical protein
MQAQFIQKLHNQKLLDEGTFPMVVRISLDLLVCNAAQLTCLRNPPPHTRLTDRFMHLLGRICSRHEQPALVVRAVCLAARSVISDVTRRRKSALQPRPLHRILLGILHELPLATAAVPWHFGLELFSHVLLEAQPQRIPGFAFCWLELLAHRNFMVPLLEVRFASCI